MDKARRALKQYPIEARLRELGITPTIEAAKAYSAGFAAFSARTPKRIAELEAEVASLERQRTRLAERIVELEVSRHEHLNVRHFNPGKRAA